MKSHFEQTSEKKFNRFVNKTGAICPSPLGLHQYSEFMVGDEVVARIDHDLDVYEILVQHGQQRQGDQNAGK